MGRYYNGDIEGKFWFAVQSNKKGFDDFFKNNNSFNDEKLENFFKKKKLDPSKINKMLEEYADLELGCKIEKCVKEQGSCHFEAEL